MSAFWHPLSAVYLDEPRALASPAIVRMILGAEGHIDLRYAGDRMWPTLRHGEPIRVVPLRSSALPHGGVVLAMADGALDVVRLRVSRHAMTGTCDADPAPPRPISREDVLGEMGTRRRGPAVPASALRLWLDLREAVTGEPESSGDPASTVRDKYDAQALHYAKGAGDALDAEVERSVRGSFAPGSRVLVAGSGTGRESFALEALGYEVVGVDFSAAMVEAARAAAARRHSGAAFVASDLRAHDEPVSSLGGILFTYDVYSFVPGSADRVALLRKMRGWLRPGAPLLLSARRWHGPRQAMTLAVQRLKPRGNGPRAEWGDSHTRWLDARGAMRRSFVRCLSDRQVDREAAAAGFSRLSWEAGHGTFVAAERA